MELWLHQQEFIQGMLTAASSSDMGYGDDAFATLKATPDNRIAPLRNTDLMVRCLSCQL